MLALPKEYVYFHYPSDEMDVLEIPVQRLLDNPYYSDGTRVEIPKDAAAIWTFIKDVSGKVIHDEFHEIGREGMVDISSISSSSRTYQFEMIIGTGKQLDTAAVRHIVRMFLGDVQYDTLSIGLWKEDQYGNREVVMPMDFVSTHYETYTERQILVDKDTTGQQYYAEFHSLIN